MSADVIEVTEHDGGGVRKVFEKVDSGVVVSKSHPETIKRVQSDLEKRLGPKKLKRQLDINEIEQVAELVNEILDKTNHQQHHHHRHHNMTTDESRVPPLMMMTTTTTTTPSNPSSKRKQLYETTLHQQQPPAPHPNDPIQGIYTLPTYTGNNPPNNNPNPDMVPVVKSPSARALSAKLVSNLLALLQVILILLFGIFTSYEDENVSAIPRSYIESKKPTSRPYYDKNFYHPVPDYNNERPYNNDNNNEDSSRYDNSGSGGRGGAGGGNDGPRYQPVTASPQLEYGQQNLHQFYYFFQDVHVMIFIGFGFLMTFLRKYGYSAVGYNLLIAAIAIQWSVLCRGIFSHSENGTIMIDVTTLINGDFAAAAVLITFGAVLGVTTPFQLMVICLIEVFLYALNEFIGTGLLKAVDVGGSMFIHTYGAYFGLSLSWVLRKNSECSSSNERSSYNSDLFSMIGTVFLWMFWPSFNGAMAEGDDQHRAVINTVLSLTASCIFTFAISGLVSPEHKFNMVHIQNATLAGGVAVGAVADLMIRPYGALIIGSIAGVVSTLGYTFVTPFLQSKINLHDTCGVNNLHGMPGIMSGLTGVVMALIASEDDYGLSLYKQYPAMAPQSNTSHLSELRKDLTSIEPGDGRTSGEQALYQLLALCITLCIAIIGGAMTGLLMKLHVFGHVPDHLLFDDVKLWEVPEEDEHGVVVSGGGEVIHPGFEMKSDK